MILFQKDGILTKLLLEWSSVATSIEVGAMLLKLGALSSAVFSSSFTKKKKQATQDWVNQPPLKDWVNQPPLKELKRTMPLGYG